MQDGKAVFLSYPKHRHKEIQRRHGSPDIVAEVFSPANTAAEIIEKRELCLASGCIEFWVVDSKKSTIEIFQRDRVTLLHSGDSIQIGTREYPLDEIFAN